MKKGPGRSPGPGSTITTHRRELYTLWRIADSNRWPAACDAAALPTELIPRLGVSPLPSIHYFPSIPAAAGLPSFAGAKKLINKNTHETGQACLYRCRDGARRSRKKPPALHSGGGNGKKRTLIQYEKITPLLYHHSNLLMMYVTSAMVTLPSRLASAAAMANSSRFSPPTR